MHMGNACSHGADGRTPRRNLVIPGSALAGAAFRLVQAGLVSVAPSHCSGQWLAITCCPQSTDTTERTRCANLGGGYRLDGIRELICSFVCQGQ
jgi:hypothetical protein